MPYIDVRIHIAEEHETEPDGSTYTHYDVEKLTHEGSDLPEEVGDRLAESLSQSDFGTIDYAQGFLRVLDGTTVKLKR